MNQPTLAELKAELEQLSKKIAELEKQPEKTAKERWEEEFLDYWDSLKFVRNFVHRTESPEAFEIELQKFALYTQLQTFAKLRNGDWVADWGSDMYKFGICLKEGKARLYERVSINALIYGISFKSEEIAQEALEIFGERIEKYYGK